MKPVYKLLQSGKLQELPFLCDEQGNLYPARPSSSKPINVNQARPDGLVITPKKSFPKMSKQQFPAAVGLTETPTGRIQSARAEVPAMSGARRTLKVVLDNQDVAAQSVLIGDAAGLYDYKNGVGPKSANVIVGGTYGTDSLTLLQAVTQSSAFDLHGLHIQNSTTAGAESEAFFNSGVITQFLVQPDAQFIDEIELPLADAVTQSTFKANIRELKDHRFQLMHLTGYFLTIPAGEKVTLTWGINAVGTGQWMQLLTQFGR